MQEERLNEKGNQHAEEGNVGQTTCTLPGTSVSRGERHLTCVGVNFD